jgi:hypothetical protein
MHLTITIRDPLVADEQAWRQLWSGYNAFYEANVPEAVTVRTWHRGSSGSESMVARLLAHARR